MKIFQAGSNYGGGGGGRRGLVVDGGGGGASPSYMYFFSDSQQLFYFLLICMNIKNLVLMGQPLTILGAFGKKVKGEYKNDMKMSFF